MYTLIGSENIKNIYKICKINTNITEDVKDINDLKLLFVKFLKEFQFQVPKPQNYTINIIDNESIENQLSKIYSVHSKLNDKAQENIIGESFYAMEKQSQIDKVARAIDLLRSKSMEYYLFLELVIHSIFFRYSNKAAGGSASSGIGVIWLNIKKSLTVFDVAELLVHELAHNYLFIDELCNIHYNYRAIYENKNYAISSILKVPRPLDKVIHSIIVSSEIILARKLFLGENKVVVHPNTSQLINDTLTSIKSVFSIKNLNNLVTKRVINLLSICKNKISIENNLSIAT